MAIIKVISDEIANELLDYHTLLILHVCFKALHEGIHLLVDGRVISNFGLNSSHLIDLGVLGTELRSGLAVLIDFLLKCNLREIQLIALCRAPRSLSIHVKRSLNSR